MSEYTYDWTTLTEDEMTTYPIEFPIEFTLEPQTKAQVNQVFGVCNEYRIHAKEFKVCKCPSNQEREACC